MRITANQLTVSRIILMPLPVAMLMTGDRVLSLAAWVLYVAIGVTDYFDGMLARRHGFTRFGRLLDPIADKIYVALTFVPLALLGFMPAWVAFLVLMRDPLITALRSLSERYGMTMQTSTLAKYKTAIQMISGGYVMWVGILPERGVTLVSMAIVAGLAWFFHVLKWRLRGRWDPRLLTMGTMMTFGLLARALVDARLTLWTYSAIILVVTWVSAWKYLVGFITGVLRSSRTAGARWWLLAALESIVVPAYLLALAFSGRVWAWIPMGIICAELAVGALDNMLTQEGGSRTVRHLAIKLSLQMLIIAISILVAVAPWVSPLPSGTTWTAIASAFGLVTLSAGVVAFMRYGPGVLMRRSGDSRESTPAPV